MLNRVAAESFSDVRAERVGRVRPFTRLSSRVVRGLGRAFLYLSIYRLTPCVPALSLALL